MSNKIKDGQLRVWWIPQVPMKPFYVMVNNLEEAKLMLDTLADYDKFQYDNKVKPDYSNMGGLEIWDERDEEDEKGEKWADWGEEIGDDFDKYCENNNVRGKNNEI